MHIYDRLGVRRVINAYECLTALGGSLMPPEVMNAMIEASESFVYLEELHTKASQRIAELIGVEAAFISAGAAAGLTLSAAACVAGTDPINIAQLPNLQGLPNQIAIDRSHRNRYDQALRLAGVDFVEFGYARGTKPTDLEAVLGPQTAAVAYFVTNSTPNTLPLPVVAEIAHRRNIPVIVDAAAELPPADNLRRFVDEGGDLVVFSGGKGLRGPQSTGLILGRKALIEACAANSSPHHSLGRSLKTSKEEIVGLLVAVERYLAESPQDRLARWENDVALSLELLSGLPGITVERIFPMPTGKPIPRTLVRVAQDSAYRADDIRTALQAGNPAIEVRPDPAGFIIDPQNLQSGDITIICTRIKEIIETPSTR